MKKITYSVEQCKYFLLLRTLKKLLGEKPYFGTDKNGNICLTIPQATETKYCKDIPQQLYYNQEQFNKTHDVRKTAQKLQWAKEILKHRNLTDEEIQLCMKIIASSIPIMKALNSEGNFSIFEGNAKGTQRYSMKSRGAILDFVTDELKRGMKPLFLTLTCDIKHYASIADAWENWLHNEFYKVTENLRKHYNAEYVATMESTAKGYPHAHIILFFPPKQFPYLKNFRNKEKIRNGKLYNLIKKSVVSPQFCLENAIGDGVKWYLTKYISKTTTTDVFKLAEKKDKYTKSERKELQELVYLKLFNKRKVLKTRKGCKSQAQESSLQAEVSVFEEQIEKIERTTERSEGVVLNSLCTNSPFNSDKSVFSMSLLDYVNNFNEPPSRKNNISDEMSDDFERKGKCLYSERSFISDFMQFVLNPKDSLLNRKFYWNAEEDIYDQLLDGYNLDDEEERLQAIAFIFDFYCTKILVDGYSYIKVLNGLENLSHSKYLRRIGFGQWDVVCSDDPKEVYKSFEEETKYFQSEARLQAEKVAYWENVYQQKMSQKYQETI